MSRASRVAPVVIMLYPVAAETMTTIVETLHMSENADLLAWAAMTIAYFTILLPRIATGHLPYLYYFLLPRRIRPKFPQHFTGRTTISRPPDLA